MSEVQVSMINTRGRVVWVDNNKVKEMRDIGWRIIVNPKEKYYPQYDQTVGKAKEDEVGANTKVVENDGYGNPLGIIMV